MKFNVNKSIAVEHINGATIPDGVSRITSIKPENDGTFTCELKFFVDEVTADSGYHSVNTEYFNMDLGGVINQIIARAKQQPSLDQATDI